MPLPTGEVVVFRHLETAQTQLNDTLSGNPIYQDFRARFDDDPFGARTAELAQTINTEFPAPTAKNDDIPLADGEVERGRRIGARLEERHRAGGLVLPDRIVTSGVVRTQETALAIIDGFPLLGEMVDDDPGMLTVDPRVKEKSTGAAESFTDTRIFQALHLDVLRERKVLGTGSKFHLRNPGGQNVPDLMQLARGWDAERDPDEAVWVFTHMVYSIAYRMLREGAHEDDDGASERYRYLLYNEAPPTGSMTTYESMGGLVVAKLNEVLA